MPKVDYLVVDTSAFIRNVQLQEFSENIITLEDVINEIKSRNQLRRLVVLPYDLILKDVFPENIKTVTEFSKKTGDYPSLSATDLKVIALTYQLEKEHVGKKHIRIEPVFTKSVESYGNVTLPPENIPGFYEPDKFLKSDVLKEEEIKSTSGDNIDLNIINHIENEDIGIPVLNDISEVGAIDEEESDSGLSENDLFEKSDPQNNLSGETFSKSDFKIESDLVEDLKMLSFKRVDSDESDDISDTDSIYDDDECGWITPGNLKESLNGGDPGAVDDVPVKVACLTTDFAMQNVLKQMGINVVSLDGKLIKHIRSYILRCHACFKTTSNMDKLFCPKCGLKTLKKVAVSVDEQGKQHIYINFKRPLTAKGKRFTIPRPRGGKHSNNPIIVEDQRIPEQRLTKKALQKTNALDADYIAGFSPFAMKDTTSKSIMLGFHMRQDMKHLMKNPNHLKKTRRK